MRFIFATPLGFYTSLLRRSAVCLGLTFSFPVTVGISAGMVRHAASSVLGVVGDQAEEGPSLPPDSQGWRRLCRDDGFILLLWEAWTWSCWEPPREVWGWNWGWKAEGRDRKSSFLVTSFVQNLPATNSVSGVGGSRSHTFIINVSLHWVFSPLKLEKFWLIEDLRLQCDLYLRECPHYPAGKDTWEQKGNERSLSAWCYEECSVYHLIGSPGNPQR